MFRLNLSTRPFYNERAVHLVLGALAVGLAVLTVVNAREVVTLSARQTALRAVIAADDAKAGDLRQRAQALRAQLKVEDLESVLAAAREANLLIDRRTFSWSELLDHLEATLPPNVMLTAVSPQIEDGAITVSIGALGRSIDDVEAFITRLERTGAFTELLSASENPEESGLVRVAITGQYRPDTPVSQSPAPGVTPAAVRRTEGAR